MVLVYVLDNHKRPLIPTTPVMARILLKQGRAKVVRKLPFTIKLQYNIVAAQVAPLTLGVDTGSSTLGSAVTDDKGNVLYLSEVAIRNDIAEKMTRRREYRRNRRYRKTRYRLPGSENRKNSIKSDRFSPTMRSKIDSHLKEIRFVESILPIKATILETASFDPHALKNPEVLANPLLYQQGINYGFANTKAYVLDRDSYTCQHCAGKSKDRRLHVHHIIFRTNGGSDEEENLVTLCKTCHVELHAGSISLKLTGKKKGQLRHATQMNSIRVQLLKRLPEARETFGYITKEHRQLFTDVKDHSVDAVFIATQGMKPIFKTSLVIQKKCVSDGDYRQTRGARSEECIPTGKIMGFRKFDATFYRGERYFIMGRMSTGYAILMNIAGETVKLKPIPKLHLMARAAARKSWIISQRTMANVCS